MNTKTALVITAILVAFIIGHKIAPTEYIQPQNTVSSQDFILTVLKAGTYGDVSSPEDRDNTVKVAVGESGPVAVYIPCYIMRLIRHGTSLEVRPCGDTIFALPN